MVPSSYLAKLIADAHHDDLRRAADRSGLGRAAREASPWPPRNLDVPITIRPARPADAAALSRLAELDSAEVPPLPILIAEANGEIRAAVSVHEDTAIADPFNQTGAMVELLRARAAQLRRHLPMHRRYAFSTLRRLKGWAT
ncbi:MAG TPA: hypothetical protein VNV17_10190 [Solirubrobacteraceae bacterium]|jgi:hypothetical protein|nr:hypothetical protein [Solirubrobacteraceae bacterium]